MESVLFDDEYLAVEWPEGFQPIPHNELETLMGFKYDCLRGMRDTKRHMMMVVTWKDSNEFLLKIVSAKMIAKRVDETFSKRYRKRYGKHSYLSDSRLERMVAGASGQAYGYRFSCTIEGVDHKGTFLVFKRGMRCYTLCYHTHSAVAAENESVYEAIVESLEIQ